MGVAGNACLGERGDTRNRRNKFLRSGELGFIWVAGEDRGERVGRERRLFVLEE